jgi:hypothetical protein
MGRFHDSKEVAQRLYLHPNNKILNSKELKEIKLIQSGLGQPWLFDKWSWGLNGLLLKMEIKIRWIM